MATFYQTQHDDSYHAERFHRLVHEKNVNALKRFKSILNASALFHFSFLILIILQTIATLFITIYLPKSFLSAASLASVVLSIFSYIVLAYYSQTRKLEQFKDINTLFFQECQKHAPSSMDKGEEHLFLARAISQLTASIRQKTIFTFIIPPFRFVEDKMVLLSFCIHFKDLLLLQEMLMHKMIQEHVQSIILSPVDLSIHTSLANAYISLSKIYQKPKEALFERSFIIDKLFARKTFLEKFKIATERAIEELKIIDNLSPNDPWTHAQLASCYHNMQLYDEEIREYEILITLRPKDKEILLRLGLLYFAQGKNAKGLQIYSILQKIDAKEAGLLIQHYSALDMAI